ncbi:MAG: DUF3127 domain-containing protein [Prevotella sp.]|nr:DUF3127 domain-containing protein [Prevotella sp.]
MELQGKIIAALPERSGTSQRGEWKVQEFVLETLDSQYPRKMVFDVFGADRLQRFNVQVGQIVNVAFDIDAREYNGRWYNSIRAYDVRQVDPNAAPAPAAAPVASPVASPVQAAGTTSAPAQTASPVAAAADDGDDLPF